MALAPLPTANVSSQFTQEQMPFPYKSIGEHVQVQAINEQELEPFLESSASVSNESPEANNEKKRMDELEKMLSEAQNRAAVVEQEAYDKAYAAGEKSGLALGEKRAEQILETLTTVLEQAEYELKALKTQSVDTLMDISEAVLTHVLGATAQDMSQVLRTTINQALTQFLPHNNGRIILVVHPQDLAMFKKITDLGEHIMFQTDQNVIQGTCRLMTGEQDALLDPKQSIQDALTYVRQHLIQHD